MVEAEAKVMGFAIGVDGNADAFGSGDCVLEVFEAVFVGGEVVGKGQGRFPFEGDCSGGESKEEEFPFPSRSRPHHGGLALGEGAGLPSWSPGQCEPA